MKKDARKSSPGGGLFRFIPRIYFSYLLIAFILFLILHILYSSSAKTRREYLGTDILSSFKGSSLDIEYVQENLLSLDQTDPQLIEYTRIRHLTPPSKLPYNIEVEGTYKDPFNEWVAEFFKNKVRNSIQFKSTAFNKLHFFYFHFLLLLLSFTSNRQTGYS